jgi:hypothetical protein
LYYYITRKCSYSNNATHQFSVTRTRGTPNHRLIGSQHPPLDIASQVPYRPAGEVGNWFGVHIGLLRGRILTPHVNGARDLTHGQVELATTCNFTNAPTRSIQELDQPGDKFVAGLRVAEAAVATKAPSESPVIFVNDHGVVASAGHLLDDNVPDWSDGLGLGVLLDKKGEFFRQIDPVKGFAAGLFNVFVFAVVADLAILGVTPHPDGS